VEPSSNLFDLEQGIFARPAKRVADIALRQFNRLKELGNWLQAS
jgi:hypothetical protein